MFHALARLLSSAHLLHLHPSLFIPKWPSRQTVSKHSDHHCSRLGLLEVARLAQQATLILVGRRIEARTTRPRRRPHAPPPI
jgi:hypothetical protein